MASSKIETMDIGMELDQEELLKEAMQKEICFYKKCITKLKNYYVNLGAAIRKYKQELKLLERTKYVEGEGEGAFGLSMMDYEYFEQLKTSFQHKLNTEAHHLAKAFYEQMRGIYQENGMNFDSELEKSSNPSTGAWKTPDIIFMAQMLEKMKNIAIASNSTRVPECFSIQNIGNPVNNRKRKFLEKFIESPKAKRPFQMHKYDGRED